VKPCDGQGFLFFGFLTRKQQQQQHHGQLSSKKSIPTTRGIIHGY
jgi:hypothetical protein